MSDPQTETGTPNKERHDSDTTERNIRRSKSLTTRTKKTPIPDNFCITEKIRTWAEKNGHTNLEERLEHFVGQAKAKGYTYADWNQAFQNAIRGDWARLPKEPKSHDVVAHTLELMQGGA